MEGASKQPRGASAGRRLSVGRGHGAGTDRRVEQATAAPLSELWPPMWKAFEAMNIEAAVPLVHPQLEWETRWPGMEGAYRGVDGLRSYLAALVEALDLDPPRLIDSYEIDASRVLLHYRISARGAGSGVDVAMEFWDIWTVREGRLFRRQVFHDREAALTASDHDR